MTLKQIILNQVKYELGHVPTKEEMKSLEEHLKVFITNKSMFADYEAAIAKWVKDNTVPCAWCEHRYLPFEIWWHASSGEHFCCMECKKDYTQEHPVA